MLLVSDAQNLPIKGMVADLVYADPPTNRGINQTAQSDCLLPDEYQAFTKNWLRECTRIMRPDSWLIVCLYHKLRYFYEHLLRTEFPILDYDHEIIWAYEFGMYTNNRFVPSHDNILVFKKGSPTFHWEEVAIPSQRMLSGDKRADWRGRTPGSVWHIPKQPGNSRNRKYLTHVCTHSRSSQPEELCERIIKAFTVKQQLVVDIFCGSGSMANVCYRNQRRWISMDLCELYMQETQNRIKLGTREKFMEMKP